MATGQWPIAEIAVEELHLDLENVRVRDVTPTQQEALNYLYDAEDVLDLAQDIARDGYIDNEIPVVTLEHGHHVVLEGNRRVSAIAGLLTPEAVPAFESRLRRLGSRTVDPVPGVIRVMVAPNRVAAQPLLARLHTQNAKKPWPRDQQAVFYHAQLNSSTTVEDLKARFPAAAGQVVRFIRMGEMRALVRGLTYADAALGDYITAGSLKMSSFEYLIALDGSDGLAARSCGAPRLLIEMRRSTDSRRSHRSSPYSERMA